MEILYRGKMYRLGTGHTPKPLPDFILHLELPPRCQEIDTSSWTGTPDRDYVRAYAYRRKSFLHIIVGMAEYNDKRDWLHVSVSRKDHILPTWEEMSHIKDVFIGENREAIQVMPPRSKHVNIYEVLHIWHCMSGLNLPDFTAGGETI